VHTHNKHQQQHQAGSSSLAADTNPSSSSSEQLEAAAGALAHLLDCCEGGVAPPPYQDLALALHAALQQRLVCLLDLAQAIFRYHTTSMAGDQQLLGCVWDAAEQGKGPAAAVLCKLATKVLQVLEPSHPTHKLVHGRVTALLAGGTAAGAAFLAAALQQEGGTLWGLPGMVEAACSGLLAACREAATFDARTTTFATATSSLSNYQGVGHLYPCLVDLPPAHTVLLQYLRGLVGVVLHLATHKDTPVSSSLAELGESLVPALAEALSLLLQSLNLGVDNGCRWTSYHKSQRPYHDAGWAALLALCECPGAAALVAALFQHQTGLLQALADSWDQMSGFRHCEEPADNAARLAGHLLLSGSIPGQEERQQQEQVLQAAVQLWEGLSPSFWRGRGDLLMTLIRLPQGRAAVVEVSNLLGPIFSDGLLPPEQQQEGWALLLAMPEVFEDFVENVQDGESSALSIVDAVLRGDVPQQQAQAILAIDGLGYALAWCCHKGRYCPALNTMLEDALDRPDLQAFLVHEPGLLGALFEEVRLDEEQGQCFWECLADNDSGDEWLLHEPAVLDAVVAALVEVDSTPDTIDVVDRLLDAQPTLVYESLLRQPSAMEGLLRVLVRGYWQPSPGDGTTCGTQRLLLNGLAGSDAAPRALALLPSLLAQRGYVFDANKLSAGVFEAMHHIQRRMGPGSFEWGAELAATSSKGAAVLCAEEQLQALRQGVEQVQKATAAAAAATQQLRDHAVVAAAGSKQGAGRRLAPIGAPTAPAVAAAVSVGGLVHDAGVPPAPKRTRS
jgi:hypothetical protein